MTNTRNYLYCTAVSLLLLIPNFIHRNITEAPPPAVIHEKYDPSLGRLQSLRSLETYTDSLALLKKIIPGTLDYAILAKEVVAQRFYHRYATKDLSSNWIAAVSEKLTGLCLSTSFTADDILKKPYGYCVQVNTVLIELLKLKHYDYKIVAFPHHFAVMSKINDNWYFFDPDQEPEITAKNRSNPLWIQSIDSINKSYKKDPVELAGRFGSPVKYSLSSLNAPIAPNAKLFQSVTNILSKTVFLLPILWAVYLGRKRKKQLATVNIQQTTAQHHNDLYGDERFSSRA
ncbi:MAG: hypothetical protein JST86_01285 [Bacteroidetes bacterium]|nr:hypothetical protein [Bacteroidota bacterium]